MRKRGKQPRAKDGAPPTGRKATDQIQEQIMKAKFTADEIGRVTVRVVTIRREYQAMRRAEKRAAEQAIGAWVVAAVRARVGDEDA